MFKKKYRVSNEELGLHWDYRSKRKAVGLVQHLNKNMGPPISVHDEFLLHDMTTGELIRV